MATMDPDSLHAMTDPAVMTVLRGGTTADAKLAIKAMKVMKAVKRVANKAKVKHKQMLKEIERAMRPPVPHCKACFGKFEFMLLCIC